jgi:hypothetical protein
MNLNHRWIGRVRRGPARLADRLTGDAASRRISRRDLIRGGTVAGLSAPLAGSLLAASGSGAPRSAKAGASRAVTLDSDVQVAQSTVVPISGGGTGETTASAAFDALAAGLDGTTSQQLLILSSSGNPGFVTAVVNVQAYGAKGNGMTDDTAAIQAALNATPAGGRCYFPMPSNFYMTTAPLLIPNQVNLQGPLSSRPSKPRDAPNPTPPIIKATGAGPSTAPGGYNMTTGFNAILTDTVYLATPMLPSSATAIENTSGATATVVISGGSVSLVQTGTSPTTLSTAGTGDGTYTLNAGYYIAVTYSGSPSPTWSWSSAPSSGITINGLVIDGSGITGSGSGHGIVLASAACSIECCGVQNTPGSGIMYADANWTGGEIGSSATAQDENRVSKCTVYHPGIDGITVTNMFNKLTDGDCTENIIDFDFGGTTTSVCINLENAGDWRVDKNHVYACPGDGFHCYAAADGKITGNQVDNFGQSATEGTYYAYDIRPSQFGTTAVIGNQVICDESGDLPAAGDGAGNSTFYYFYVENYAAGNAGRPSVVYFIGNGPHQVKSGSGDSYAWGFNANSGTLNIYGFNSTTGVMGPASTVTGSAGTFTTVTTPQVTGTVNFPDQVTS